MESRCLHKKFNGVGLGDIRGILRETAGRLKLDLVALIVQLQTTRTTSQCLHQPLYARGTDTIALADTL